jgi:carbonic anhydrase
MIDIVYRFITHPEGEHRMPESPADARERLEGGNRAFTRTLARGLESPEPLVIPFDLAESGLGHDPSVAPKQEPFALVLGCSDARVPTEMVFSQACNDLFVVRVAGNVLGSECLGSIDYAVSHLKSLKLLVVLGHSGCGAVTACVDSFLAPASYLEIATSHSLRAVVDRISIGVRAAARGLETVYGADVTGRPGYRLALVETTVVVHAALTAHTLEREFAGRAPCQAVFGVYDLVTRCVGLPTGATGAAETRLVAPPRDSASFAELMTRVVSSEGMRRVLDGGP